MKCCCVKSFHPTKLKNMNETYFFINRFLWSVALLRCCWGGDCGGFTVVRMMGWVEVEWLVCRWRQIVCVHACKQFDCFHLVTCELGYIISLLQPWNLFTAELDEMSIISTTKHQKSNGTPPLSADTRNRSQTEDWYEWWVQLHKEVIMIRMWLWGCGGIACPNHLI